MGRSKAVDVAAAKASGSTVGGAAAAAASPAAPSSSSSALKTTTARPESAGGRAAMISRHAHAHAQLPGPLRLVLVVLLSYAFSSLGQSLLPFWTDGKLSSIARRPESKTEYAVLAAWRIFGLALGWFGDFDGYDLAALALLSSGPATYLITEFYGIRALTAGAYLGVDVVSAFLPFLLLRQLSGAHSAAPGVPNREIVVDRGIQVLTSLLSSLIYSVVLYLALRTYLPTTLVLYFDGIPTIRPAVDAVLLGFGSPVTQVLSLLFGIAARTFIFTPLVTTPPSAQDQEISEFDPVGATLGQTVAFNLWGFTGRTKVSIKRTAVAMLFTAVGTYLQCAHRIKGVEPYGAAVYASVWVIAAMVTGLSLRYVGSI